MERITIVLFAIACLHCISAEDGKPVSFRKSSQSSRTTITRSSNSDDENDPMGNVPSYFEPSNRKPEQRNERFVNSDRKDKSGQSKNCFPKLNDDSSISSSSKKSRSLSPSHKRFQSESSSDSTFRSRRDEYPTATKPTVKKLTSQSLSRFSNEMPPPLTRQQRERQQQQQQQQEQNYREEDEREESDEDDHSPESEYESESDFYNDPFGHVQRFMSSQFPQQQSKPPQLPPHLRSQNDFFRGPPPPPLPPHMMRRNSGRSSSSPRFMPPMNF